MLRTMQAASEVAQLAGHPLSPSRALVARHTRCGARRSTSASGSAASSRGATPISSSSISRSTPLIDFRMRYVDDIDDALAVQLALGDDRAIRATYVAGRLAWDRDAAA